MAVVVRCSFPSSRPNLDEFFRRSMPYQVKISGRIHASAKPDFKYIPHAHMVKIFKQASEVKQLLKSEKLLDIPFQRARVILSFTDRSRRTHTPFVMDQVFSSVQSLCSKPTNFLITKWEGTRCISQRLSDYENLSMEHKFAHQNMVRFGYCAMAFSVANALMLSVPFDALAETCDASSPLFDMPLLLAVALIGATVGGKVIVFVLGNPKCSLKGLLARQRRGELKRLNDQLRQINAALRRQAKIESYAPALSYAPIGSRIPEEVIVDSKKQELISHLKTGKNFLRNQDPDKAYVEFKAALELAQNLKDPVEEKKAARGLGASLQRQGKYREAIKYHSMVLGISERVGEDSGNTEAYGAIADCYTELGDLERAGKFYDKYIARLETD